MAYTISIRAADYPTQQFATLRCLSEEKIGLHHAIQKRMRLGEKEVSNAEALRILKSIKRNALFHSFVREPIAWAVTSIALYAKINSLAVKTQNIVLFTFYLLSAILTATIVPIALSKSEHRSLHLKSQRAYVELYEAADMVMKPLKENPTYRLALD